MPHKNIYAYTQSDLGFFFFNKYLLFMMNQSKFAASSTDHLKTTTNSVSILAAILPFALSLQMLSNLITK